jgi:Flp pilus assembly protein TadB
MNATAALACALVVVTVAARVRPVPRGRTPGVGATRSADAEHPTLDVLDDIDRDLRTGVALSAAVTAALRRNPRTLGSLRRALDGGAQLEVALRAAVPADPAEAVVVQTLRACERTGGRMGAAVERAALVLRERTAWQRERRVHAAQARLSATVLTLVPLVFAAWGLASSPRIRRAYVEVPACGVAAVAGLGLNALGWLWMRRLVAGSTR